MRNSMIGGVAVLSLFLMVANIAVGDVLPACAGSGGVGDLSSSADAVGDASLSASVAVPEPATIVILGLGAVVIFVETRKHRY